MKARLKISTKWGAEKLTRNTCFKLLRDMKLDEIEQWAVRAIFVRPWNENARTKQKQQKNGNRAIWLVYRTDTNAPGFWLVKRTLGWKNFMPEELSRNRFDVILQHDWSIEQCLLHIRVFFGGKTKSPCFVLFNHWLTKQLTNTYRNHFSRTYKNRSNLGFVMIDIIHGSMGIKGLMYY